MYDYREDRIKDECGVFGVYGSDKSATLTYLGLFSLQHRGEESAGIAVYDGNLIKHYKAMGLVGDIFDEDILATLNGTSAIGHVRYSTTGASILKNAQPHVVSYLKGQVAIAHNGNLVNAEELRRELEGHGSIFQSTMDSEIIVHLMAKPTYMNNVDGLIGAMKRIRGAYSVVLLTENSLIGARDPHGFRPLSIARLGDAWILSSETCSFDLIGADYLRDVEPGEVVIIDENGIKSIFPFECENIRRSYCIFEHIYFARPDSVVFGDNVGDTRYRLGRKLAKESPADADLVISVPDSGNFAALGYSHESRIPFGFGFTRNHYVGRTFISPMESKRDFNVKIKLNPIRDFIKGKRLVVIDDSIVRGNTSKSRVKVLRKAGAKEVHLRISCPPHKWPCFYGIDFPSKEELIANRMNIEKIRDFLEVDTLGYLSVDGMMSVFNGGRENYCVACFTGNYSVSISENHGGKMALER